MVWQVVQAVVLETAQAQHEQVVQLLLQVKALQVVTAKVTTAVAVVVVRHRLAKKAALMALYLVEMVEMD
jgi:hypothetical protein